MTDLLLGVDVGGTKTHACLSTTHGEVIGFGVAGGGNWESVGLDAVREVLATAVDACFIDVPAFPSDIVAATFSMAGMDWPSDEARLRTCTQTLGIGGQVSIVNDSFGALRAGITQSFGLVNNAGTGGVTAGRNRAGRVFRTMAEGWGEGNGSSGLVTAAAHEMALAHHGQVPPTALTLEFQRLSGYSTALGMFEAMARGGWELGSQHAPIVLDLAGQGDPAAIRATVSVAEQHARDVIGVARVLDMIDDEAEVVLAGSVHAHANPVWTNAFTAVLSASFPGATLVPLDAPPVIGSVLLAADSLGIQDSGLKAKLKAGMSRIEPTRPLAAVLGHP
jgi:N-acetylglucosamine kinase-like BadF-type ATPase